MYRLENKKTTKLSIILILSVLAISNPSFFVRADKSSDLQTQKAQKQQQLAQLNHQIQQFQNQIKQKQQEQASLSNEINLYNIEIQSTQLQIQATQTNMDNTNLEISQTKIQIDQKSKQIEQEKLVLGQLLNSLDQYDNASGLQIGLSSNNFSDFMDQVQYTESMQNNVYSLLQQIKDLKSKLQDDQTALQNNYDKLAQLNTQLNQTQTILSDQKTAKVQLLNQTRGQEKNYQKLLVVTQQQENAVNQEIYDLNQQIQGKKGFRSLAPIHGILAWPMDGVVTQGYGNTGFTRLGYNFHDGIDIAAPADAPIYAAGDGVVYATGTGQTAYGNWVTIKHNISAAGGHGIITLYGHLMSFKVSAGQTVKQGDLIGYEGNTGNTTRLLYGPERGYHLHFGVFDAQDFGINQGKYQNVYGPYQVPYGFTYNPMDFL